jgi:Ca2+-binding RTX toxin-like protein
MLGGNGDDVLLGLAGNDNLSGGADEDVLFGGLGNDILNGGEDNDSLYGQGGNDVLRARDGSRDLVRGSVGRDKAQIDKIDRPSAIETLLK